MKIYKKTIFTTILFLTCITNTYAACTQEEINEFKKIEDQYTVKYEFNKDTKDYTLTFNAPRMDEYSYQLNLDMNKVRFKNSTETSFTFSGILAGEYKFEIAGIKGECEDVLKTITLNLSEYNKFADDPLCEGIEEFVLCQPIYEKEIDYETFVSRVNTYKKSKEKKEQKQEPQQTAKENPVLEYIQENLIQIIIIVIFIILVIITTCVTIKSIRKSRRLE